MGSRGRGAFKSLVLGSVATKVLSQSDVPVTIVR
jgi:nucleotide-binding universal stress UspA family protein